MNIYEAYLELLNDKIIETDIGDIIFQSSESFTFKKRFYKICESDVSDNALIPFDELDIEDIAVELEEIPLSAFKYNFTSYEPEEFKAKWEASRKKLNVKENRG